MLRSSRNPDGRAWFQTDGLLTFCLVPSRTGSTQQNLVAAAIAAVVNLPVDAAARFKGDVFDGHWAIGKHCEIALPSKVAAQFLIG